MQSTGSCRGDLTVSARRRRLSIIANTCDTRPICRADDLHLHKVQGAANLRLTTDQTC